jgi:hypothetical protein
MTGPLPLTVYEISTLFSRALNVPFRSAAAASVTEKAVLAKANTAMSMRNLS